MFEHRSAPLLQKSAFTRRMLFSVLLGSLFILFTISFGMFGYHYIEELSWVDAFLEASMIFAGMGAIATMQTVAGKIFAGCYAILSAFSLLVPISIILSPILHRFLHRFHLDDGDE